MNSNDSEMLLKEAGIKPTANRMIVLRELAAARRPLSMTELEATISTIDKSNIFRALMVFKDHGLLHSVDDGECTRYELCRSAGDDSDDDQHVHFHCEVCRKTFCIDSVNVPHVDLPEGYHVTAVNYVLKGVCPQCRRKVRNR